jgi:RNA polymerase-binding transcription factor DksA
VEDEQEPPAPDPEVAADRRATAAERARELAVAERAQSALDDVDRALARLDAGTYGTCEVCGAALPDEELAARPAARLCAEHGPPVADPS